MNWEELGKVRSPKPKFQNPSFKSLGELGKFKSQFKIYC